MIKDRILLFFYIDNIIIVYYKNKLNAATKAVNMLKKNTLLLEEITCNSSLV
jgi:hypothetical protein